MSPTRNFSGTCSRKRLAAFSAASSRVGSTSVARIEPETSIASTTDAWLRGTFVTSWGRAVAKRSAASAARNRTGGTQRRQRGDSATTFASRSTFVKRRA